MRILVIGAHHGLGAAVLRRARAAGHDAAPFEGDLFEGEALARSVAGQEAVISTLGPRRDSPADLCARGAGRIIAAMRAAGVRRLISVSGAMVAEDVRLGLIYRLIRAQVPGAILADMRRAEALVRDSGLDWTLVRPVRLTDAPGRGHWQADPGARVGGLARIAREDVAQAMLAALDDPATHGQALLLQR